MSEVVYSTIREGETGKLISISVPYDPSTLSTDEDIVFARAIHANIQQRIQQWFDEQFAMELNGR